MAGFHLAQVNIALPRAPLDSPLLADFVAALAPINALADQSPGFVWRMQSGAGDATSIHGFGDDRLVINMSTWESLEALSNYVYKTQHVEIMRQRRTWFETLREVYAALWWVPIGHRPSVAEAEQRVASLRERGPTAFAFTFKQPFSAPDVAAKPTASAESCP